MMMMIVKIMMMIYVRSLLEYDAVGLFAGNYFDIERIY